MACRRTPKCGLFRAVAEARTPHLVGDGVACRTRGSPGFPGERPGAHLFHPIGPRRAYQPSSPRTKGSHDPVPPPSRPGPARDHRHRPRPGLPHHPGQGLPGQRHHRAGRPCEGWRPHPDLRLPARRPRRAEPAGDGERVGAPRRNHGADRGARPVATLRSPPARRPHPRAGGTEGRAAGRTRVARPRDRLPEGRGRRPRHPPRRRCETADRHGRRRAPHRPGRAGEAAPARAAAGRPRPPARPAGG